MPNRDGFLASEKSEPLPLMAMDAMPKARLPGARDQDPDDDTGNGTNSPAQEAYKKLFQFLADRIDPDDLQQVGTMIQELLGSTDEGKGAALASDRRLVTPGYSKHYPNANRLRTKTYG